MSEIPSNPIEFRANYEKEQRIKRIFSLAMALIERRETFPFPGIDPGSYLKMKVTDEEFPGCATPIDELIERFKREKMKVALGKDPDSGNVYILPAGSDDIENDGISPEQLSLKEVADENLKELILIKRT